ncbi:hypothetical protein BJY52DRAFT_1192902 [Lactarius psammicola]|nr:hypothetical protein BJY52DRAFT_1192902 [Lactarius psammicola]
MARRTRNSQRLMRNQTPGALGETYASLDLSSHADTMNTTSGVAGQGVNVQRSDNPTPPQTNLIGNRKRTTSSRNNGPEDIPTNAATGQPVPVKRPRNVGPARSRPLQLELAGESEIRQSQSDGVACVSRGGQQTVRPASSHAIVLNPEPTSLPNDDESHGESEEWSSEEDMADLTPGQPGRFNEAVANERPIWKGLATTTGPTTSVRRTSSAQGLTSHDDVSPWSNAVSVSRTSSTQTLTSCDDTSYGSNSTEPVLESEVPALAPAPLGSHLGNVSAESTSAWPVDTELQFAPGATRVMLTIQRPLMRSVIQDAIEILRASLMFDNAFPDSIHTLAFVRRSLLTSARKRCPTALSIHTRLVQDEDYISKIIPVLRARISLFRSEVKELCTSLVSPIFLSMTPGPKVALFAQRQLSNYNYTFPGQGGGNAPVRRLQPYRNERIIRVIRDLYFTGGNSSFSARFSHLFPGSYSNMGYVMEYEVPVPMVALVATALYASIHEWRTGSRQPVEFSTSAYFDVYKGHIDTFQLIRENQGKFHVMMADIYSKASDAGDNEVSGPVLGTMTPMTELDLENLE